MAAGKKQNDKDAMAVINEHIKNESYAPVYLLYGDETYLVNQYRDKLLSAVTDRDDNMNFAKFAGEKTDPMESNYMDSSRRFITLECESSTHQFHGITGAYKIIIKILYTVYHSDII